MTLRYKPLSLLSTHAGFNGGFNGAGRIFIEGGASVHVEVVALEAPPRPVFSGYNMSHGDLEGGAIDEINHIRKRAYSHDGVVSIIAITPGVDATKPLYVLNPDEISFHLLTQSAKFKSFVGKEARKLYFCALKDDKKQIIDSHRVLLGPLPWLWSNREQKFNELIKKKTEELSEINTKDLTETQCEEAVEKIQSLASKFICEAEGIWEHKLSELSVIPALRVERPSIEEPSIQASIKAVFPKRP